MPDLYRRCPATGCDHEEAIPSEADPEGSDDPSYADLWDHVSTAHADGSARATGDLMAVTQVMERANPGDTKPGDCPICGPLSGCRCANTLQVSNLRFEAMQDGEWVDVPGITSAEIHIDPEPELDDFPLLAPAALGLARRLVDRHGLTPADAARAVSRYAYGKTSEHTDLVRAESQALLAEIFVPICKAMNDLMAGLAPAFKALGEAAVRAGKAMQDDYQLVQGVSRASDRPAWQSPHGPAQKGHRR